MQGPRWHAGCTTSAGSAPPPAQVSDRRRPRAGGSAMSPKGHPRVREDSFAAERFMDAVRAMPEAGCSQSRVWGPGPGMRFMPEAGCSQSRVWGPGPGMACTRDAHATSCGHGAGYARAPLAEAIHFGQADLRMIDLGFRAYAKGRGQGPDYHGLRQYAPLPPQMLRCAPCLQRPVGGAGHPNRLPAPIASPTSPRCHKRVPRYRATIHSRRPSEEWPPSTCDPLPPATRVPPTHGWSAAAAGAAHGVKMGCSLLRWPHYLELRFLGLVLRLAPSGVPSMACMKAAMGALTEYRSETEETPPGLRKGGAMRGASLHGAPIALPSDRTGVSPERGSRPGVGAGVLQGSAAESRAEVVKGRGSIACLPLPCQAHVQPAEPPASSAKHGLAASAPSPAVRSARAATCMQCRGGRLARPARN